MEEEDQKGMSKKERKLREEIAELEQKKTRGFMQTAGGIIIFVLFLIFQEQVYSGMAAGAVKG